MTIHVIKNRVPSAEEMGRKLGVSAKRVATVRVIMSSPSISKKSSKRSSGKSRVAGKKKVNAKRSSGRR